MKEFFKGLVLLICMPIWFPIITIIVLIAAIQLIGGKRDNLFCQKLLYKILP